MLYICVSFWLLAHESRDYFQAETKKILLTVEQIKKWLISLEMTILTERKLLVEHFRLIIKFEQILQVALLQQILKYFIEIENEQETYFEVYLQKYAQIFVGSRENKSNLVRTLMHIVQKYNSFTVNLIQKLFEK